MTPLSEVRAALEKVLKNGWHIQNSDQLLRETLEACKSALTHLSEVEEELAKWKCAAHAVADETGKEHAGCCDSHGRCLACSVEDDHEFWEKYQAQKAEISRLRAEVERLVKLNESNSHEYHDKCGCGFCYAMRQHEFIYEQLKKELRTENTRLKTALENIEQQLRPSPDHHSALEAIVYMDVKAALQSPGEGSGS